MFTRKTCALFLVLAMAAMLAGCGKGNVTDRAQELLSGITRPGDGSYTCLSADISIIYVGGGMAATAQREEMGGTVHLSGRSPGPGEGVQEPGMSFELWADGGGAYLSQDGGPWEAVPEGDVPALFGFDEMVDFAVAAQALAGTAEGIQIEEGDMSTVVSFDTAWGSVSGLFPIRLSAGQGGLDGAFSTARASFTIGMDRKLSRLVVEAGDPEGGPYARAEVSVDAWGEQHGALEIPDAARGPAAAPEVIIEKKELPDTAASYEEAYDTEEGFSNEALAAYGESVRDSGMGFDKVELASGDGYDEMLYYSHGPIGDGGMWFSVLELEQHEAPEGALDRYNGMCAFNEAFYGDAAEEAGYGVPYGWLLCRAWAVYDDAERTAKLDICGVLEDGSVLELQVESYLCGGIGFEDLDGKARLVLDAAGL